MSAANAAAKQFSPLSQLGFMLANYLIKKYPIPDYVQMAQIHDKTFGATFMFTRKGDNILVSVVKHDHVDTPVDDDDLELL